MGFNFGRLTLFFMPKKLAISLLSCPKLNLIFFTQNRQNKNRIDGEINQKSKITGGDFGDFR
jgi:hypothetical protein